MKTKREKNCYLVGDEAEKRRKEKEMLNEVERRGRERERERDFLCK